MNGHRFSQVLQVILAAFCALPVQAATGAPDAAPELRHTAAARIAGAVNATMLAAATAGKRIVAVGEHGIILLSDDGGRSYRQPALVPVGVVLTDVSFADERNGWAVGHWGVVIHTSDGGETWAIQRTDTDVDQPLFSVHFRNAQEGWAVGLWSLLLTTRDGGQTWATVQPPAPSGHKRADLNLYRIFPDAAGHLYVAAEQGRVMRSSDNGASWNWLDTGYKGSFWSGIALRDGTLLVGGLRGTIYRSADGGATWHKAASPLKNSITAFAESEGRLLAVGLDGVRLESRDGGATFTGAQREDRLPLTAVLAPDGRGEILFSRRGPVR